MKNEIVGLCDYSPLNEAEQLAEEAATWFLRMRASDLSTHEQQNFQNWLESSEAHQQEYQHFEKLWGALDVLPRPTPKKKPVARNAAAILAAFLLAFVYQNITVDEQNSTKIGETRQLKLADGTVIDVDADTKLHVEYSLWRRRITLEQGQALFTVAAGLRPFEVKAGKGTLRDIGTSFNVQEDQGKVTVSVIEGLIEASMDTRPEKWLISAGQQASYHVDSVSSIQAINPETAQSWRQNRFVFEAASLGEVVRQINHQHERPITLADATLERYRISGVFDRTDRAGLLKALSVILPIKAEETPGSTQLHQR